ncbi:hypothetical protein NIES2119_27835 [[Phormidium ambiguum] IAM M-71]|uniref:Uncharacterized protein n=1 Tax=[Phormidium ambiguum] IAM M-71 TaxID=454136 RepID=A0A1U7I699_9CYAN|nr:hypothetical protein [Phormidium ambiguum]OKH31784.1 hypothetical protein NIES2119_27835 [Phormidium ambiguum IAM M-71]
MLKQPIKHFKNAKFLVWVTVLCASSVVAQTANYGSINVAPGFEPSSAIATGSTSGSFSLFSIANRDRDDNFCVGYSTSATPDHLMTLQKNFPHLKLELRSGRTTTLVVRGPNGVIRCGIGSIDDQNWKAGEYQIWVGSKDEGVRGNYTLLVRE